MNRTTILTLLVFLLIAVNSVTLFLLFKKSDAHERRPNPGMFFKKLGLDEQQEQQFEELRKAHFRKRDSLRNEDMRLRKAMAGMINNNIQDSAAVDSMTHLLAANRKQFETNFYYHFHQMRSLLRPEQQQKFGEVLEAILKRQGPPPGIKQGPPHP
ncbi:MAG TPA: periplasmic heavy metal sensor [Lacibacter sp.]|nr:periplasmic heavy metal sensor [Lacibacter sp.]